MTKLELIKTAATVVVGAGTTRIVTGIISSNVPQEKVTDKVTVPAAGVVIGMMVAEKTKAYTDAFIDEVAVWYKNTVTK